MEEILIHPKKNKIVKAVILEDLVSLTVGFLGAPQGIVKTISRDDWPAYKAEKLNTGYVLSEVEVIKTEEKLHPELAFLKQKSKHFLEEHINTSIQYSATAIEKAKIILKKLTMEKDLFSFNEKLYDLFGLIPRRMKNPILSTAKSTDDFQAILERENDILDNLDINEIEENHQDIIFEEVSVDALASIKDMFHRIHVQQVFKVISKEADARFKAYCKENNIQKTKLLLHGSRTENWFSIIYKGLQTNPINVIISGKMWGNGIYFANQAEKSARYTSLKNSTYAQGKDNFAYIGVYEVATGKEYKIAQWSGGMVELNEESFRKKTNCDSLHAVAGVSLLHDEFIVYNNNAVRLKYLVKIV